MCSSDLCFKSLALALSLYGSASVDTEFDWALPRRLQSSLRVENESNVFRFTESMVESKKKTARDWNLDLFQILDLLTGCSDFKIRSIEKGNSRTEANKRVYSRLTS